MSSLTTLSNEELTMKIELVKKYINDLDGIKKHNEHLKTVLKSLIENNTEHINVISDLKNEYALRVLNYKTHMDRYQRELQELEMEKLKRNKRNLCRAVSRNQSRNAVRTLLTRPHYSQIPNIPNSQSGFLRYLSPSLVNNQLRNVAQLIPSSTTAFLIGSPLAKRSNIFLIRVLLYFVGLPFFISSI